MARLAATAGSASPHRPYAQTHPWRRAEAPAFCDLLPIPAVLLDQGGRIYHANRVAHSTFGDALGAVIRHPAVQSVLATLTPETGVVTRVELDVPVRRIVQVTFRKWSERFASDIGWVDGVLAVLEDCSEFEVVDRMRADFVAYASHELRTPLASLIGFIETFRGQLLMIRRHSSSFWPSWPLRPRVWSV